MDNDLISREALKEDFDCAGFNDYDDYNRALRIIDDAPAVDLTKNQAYDKGFITAMKLYARPQGEWIFRSGGYYKCNKCGEVERAEKNFCPNCGVKMRAVQNEKGS